jgi:hypothetical protein
VMWKKRPMDGNICSSGLNQTARMCETAFETLYRDQIPE